MHGRRGISLGRSSDISILFMFHDPSDFFKVALFCDPIKHSTFSGTFLHAARKMLPLDRTRPSLSVNGSLLRGGQGGAPVNFYFALKNTHESTPEIFSVLSRLS